MLIDEIIIILKLNYGINVKDYYTINRLMFRQNYIVEDDIGSKYIVKYYPKGIGSEKINSICDYYKWLEKIGYFTNKLLQQHNNSFYFTLSNGIYLVYEYITAQILDFSDLTDIGKELRNYHYKVNDRNPTIALEKTSFIIERSKTLFEDFYKCKENDFVNQVLSYKNIIFYILENYCSDIDTIVHGDCSFNNMLKTMQNTICLIDFDNAHYGNHIEDLAYMVFSIMHYGNKPLSLSFNRSDKIMMLLNAYYGIPISSNEVFEIEKCMKLNCSIELIKHAPNYRFISRTPGTLNYLSCLLKIIITDRII